MAQPDEGYLALRDWTEGWIAGVAPSEFRFLASNRWSMRRVLTRENPFREVWANAEQTLAVTLFSVVGLGTFIFAQGRGYEEVLAGFRKFWPSATKTSHELVAEAFERARSRERGSGGQIDQELTDLLEEIGHMTPEPTPETLALFDMILEDAVEPMRLTLVQVWSLRSWPSWKDRVAALAKSDKSQLVREAAARALSAQ